MSTQGRLLLVAVVTLAGLVVAPASSADRAVARDGVGDTWSPEGYEGWKPTGSPANVDLVRTAIDHRASRVVLTAKYTDLVRGEDVLDLTLRLRSYAGRTWRFSVRASYYDPVTFRMTERAHGAADCEGFAGSLSFARDTVRLVVPRRCLGQPDRVKYAALAERYNEGAGLSIDHALSTEPEPRIWSPWIRVG